MTRIAIVGAGVAGLTVAYGLRTCPVECVVFEKSRGYGGRAATRGRYGCRYDYGARFFGAPTRRVRDLVTAHLPTEQLVEIGGTIGTFTEDGDLLQGEGGDDEQQQWTYRRGISTLGKLLARASRAEVRHRTRIAALERTAERWRLRADDGASFQPYDAVVLTAPAPQTAALLDASEGDGSLRALRRAVEAVDYAPQFAYALAYDRPIRRPGRMHGVVSRAPAHPLAWIGFENDKPGHVRRGTHLLIVQTGTEWTRPRVDREPESVLPEVKAQVAKVLSTRVRQPVWVDTQRWRYARPCSGLDGGDEAATDAGVYVAGDYVSGTGTVGAAIESGFSVARRLRAAMG